MFAMMLGSVAGCKGEPALVQLVEARRLASDLYVQFTKAADAANRAVMADTDEASAGAAREAEQAKQAVQQDVDRLQAILQSLGYAAEIQHLDAFTMRFAEYQILDQEILPLAVENTNLKAQRLSFGTAQEAADSFRTPLEAAAKSATSKDTDAVAALVARAIAALLEIQVIQARHIAEADEAAMSRMEAHITTLEGAVQSALDTLKKQVPSVAGSQLTAASAAFERFKMVNAEIMCLSRRNSNVRSLALSMGRKRTVTAQCDDQLRALDEALSKHEFSATR
jgi:hypothetical protein